jgi:hypothetical protein
MVLSLQLSVCIQSAAADGPVPTHNCTLVTDFSERQDQGMPSIYDHAHRIPDPTLAVGHGVPLID